MSSAVDWPAFRAEFPALERFVNLNTAAGAPLSRAAAAAGARYYEEALEGGDIHWRAWLARADAARAIVGRFLNAPAETVAFLGNASQALDLAERLIAGDALAVADDFPSLTFPWLNRGRRVVFAPLDADGRPMFEAVPASEIKGLKALVVGHVHFRTGYRLDLEEAARFAAAHGLELVIDATQTMGVFDIDTAWLEPALVTFSAYKWLAGGYGAGGVHVRPDLLARGTLPAAGWRSAAVPYDLTTDRFVAGRAASVLEQGHPPFAPLFALAEGLALIERTGRGAVTARVLEMGHRLEAALAEHGRQVSFRRKPASATGIVLADCPDAAAVQARLRDRGVLVSRWGERLRLSVHAYSNDADIGAGMEAWRNALG